MGFSVLPLMDFLARRAFLAAGLRPHTISLPSDGSGGQHTVHYWAPPGEPRLPPLLLIHGFGPMATWQWRRQVGPFSRHFHVIVPDLLCFGASSPSSGSPPPSESAQAAALAALLDALPGLAPAARVAVAGTSYGGFVAYALARAAGPERVGPVVISNSDLLKTADDDRALLDRAGGGCARTSDLLMPLDARAARRLMELSFYRRQPIALLPDFVIRDAVQKLFTDRREEKIELMKAITVGTNEFQLTPLPQTFCSSGESMIRYFPWKGISGQELMCLGENVKLEIFKKTGHVPQMEDPDRFNEVVLEFLLASQKAFFNSA
ncbi:hypothetical protein ACP70R_002147 [Stipagrostis hirtigluma subsp. patula]